MIKEPKNDPIFLIYYLSSICWYISILNFKTFKIQFHGFSFLFLEIRHQTAGKKLHKHLDSISHRKLYHKK